MRTTAVPVALATCAFLVICTAPARAEHYVDVEAIAEIKPLSAEQQEQG